MDDGTHLNFLRNRKKFATYAYYWKCDFSAVEFLEVIFRPSEWCAVHDAFTQLSLSQRTTGATIFRVYSLILGRR